MDNFLTRLINNFLSQQEQRYGQLKLLSADTRETARSIDVIACIVTRILRYNSRFDMYNIKIFVEDSNFETRKFDASYTKFYNYFLVNTNFSSQYLLKNDMKFGHLVGLWPTLSTYLFLQIMWISGCEDLLIESLVHLPLDLCIEILEVTIKHIVKIEHKLERSQARRCIFLLIYKIHYKCLWLHFGTLSEQNVNKCISQLVTCFETLCDLLASCKFLTSRKSSIKKDPCSHGILIKNILRYIRKCMHSKIEKYSENHNLAKLFSLTYGNFNGHMNYLHKLPVNEVKSTVLKLEQKLATLLLNQIENLDNSKFVAWEDMNDDENIMITLQRAIVIECCSFIKFMRQNEFLMTNKHMFHCLERLTCLVDSKKRNESILTLQELCQGIAGNVERLRGGLQIGMKELIKRYKEWDRSVLDFINERFELFDRNDFYIVLEYFHHIFPYLRTKAEKYQVYISVLKILLKLKMDDICFIMLKYVEKHFDDKRLEYLYDGNCFDAFIRNSFNISRRDMPRDKEKYALLIFILLNPKEVLSKLVIYEISGEFSESILFRGITVFMEQFYQLMKDQCNILIYILKNIVLRSRMIWYRRFLIFMNNVIFLKIISADDVMNEIYIPYLISSYIDMANIHILLHIQQMLKKKYCMVKTNFVLLITALIKTASILRRCNTIFTIGEAWGQMEIINNIIDNLYRTDEWRTEKQKIISIRYSVEPLDMPKICPMIGTPEIIQEYEKRCFAVHQQLRTNPRCHPKLRIHVQSFNLDREAFIRHMILHCRRVEYESHMFNMTFVSWYHFGWTNQIMAYENIMRITAEASQIALTYTEKFHKDTFLGLLYGIVNFSDYVDLNMTWDTREKIHRIFLRTLCCMNYTINVSCDNKHNHLRYNVLLQRIKDVSPLIKEYFFEISELIWIHTHKIEFLEDRVANLICICDEQYCKYYGIHIKKKIPAMYNAYLFISECIKFSCSYPIVNSLCYSKRLLRNLHLEE